jgi:hypothetical protein
MTERSLVSQKAKSPSVPAIVAEVGPEATKRFSEFFTDAASLSIDREFSGESVTADRSISDPTDIKPHVLIERTMRNSREINGTPNSSILVASLRRRSSVFVENHKWRLNYRQFCPWIEQFANRRRVIEDLVKAIGERRKSGGDHQSVHTLTRCLSGRSCFVSD